MEITKTVSSICTTVLLTVAVAAQQSVTTSGGTTNAVPIFSGTSSISNSAITQSNGSIGIGTSSPQDKLDVSGGVQSTVSSPVGGSLALGNPAKTTAGSAAVWRIYNMSGGYGNSLQFWAYDNAGCNGGGLCASRLTLTDGGNVGIGTQSPGTKLEVNGNVRLTSGSGATLTFADGSIQNTAWTGTLCGGDYAESVDVSGEHAQYEPGDVMVIDRANRGRFVKSSSPYSKTVAGIYSTKPGVLGKRFTDPEKVKSEIPMAMVGIVPTKVSVENGSIDSGDLLVTSSTPGYAMKGTDGSRMLGAVLGKALGSLNSESGVIDVLVTLQ